MAKIEPFCGIRFNSKKVGSLSKVVCPPYDVIDRQQRKQYLKKSRHNAVSLVLPKGKSRHNGHMNAKKLLENWLNSDILIRDEKPSIYIYLQRYKIDKTIKSRLGFISLIELEDKKKVLPHEKIFDKFKFERFNLMRTARAHLSPIFTVFNDEGRGVEKLLSSVIKNKKPIIDIKVEGVREKLWKIQDRDFISNLRQLIHKKKVFIADGHHRFEASLYLRDYMREKQCLRKPKMPYDYALIYFLSMQDKGLSILPTHRAIRYLPNNFSKEFMLNRLSKHFQIRTLKTKAELVKRLQMADKRKRHAFGFFYGSSYIFALLKNEKAIKDIDSAGKCLSWKKLDVSILHYFILPKLLNIKERVNRKRNIYYYRGMSFAVKMVKKGKFKLAIFLNPTRIEQVEAIAKSGNKMPHKSTYFYPKLLTGLVIHKF